MNWFYYELDGVTKHPITAESPIASLIEESSLYMDIQVDENYGTYMLRSRGSGGGVSVWKVIFSPSQILIDLLQSLSLENFPSDTALPSMIAIPSGRIENKLLIVLVYLQIPCFR